MNKFGSNLLIYLDILSLTLTVLSLIYYWHYIKEEKVLLPIVTLVISQFLLIGLSHILYLQKQNNHWVFHINANSSFFLISLFFTNYLPNRIYIKFLQICLPILYVLLLQNTIFKFNSIGFASYSFFIVLLCLIYYLSILKKPLIPNIVEDATFWFVTALFIYYTCSFVIFVSYEALSNKGIKVGYLWRVHNVFVFLYSITMIYAFSKFVKNESSNNTNN